MIVDKTVVIKWNGSNRKHYELKGYTYSGYNAEFECKTNDLLPHSSIKLKVVCDICGEETMAYYSNYIRATEEFGRYCCSKCSGSHRYYKNKHTIEEARELFTKNGYELLEDTYVDINTPMKYLCDKHGVQYKSFKHMSRGTRCPECAKESKGEQYIREWLDKQNITHSRQYTFQDLRSDKGTILRFDFAVFGNNNSLKLLIEYQGKQHYEPIEYFGGEERFHRQQQNDNIKVKYCELHDIPLLRISYTEFSYLADILQKTVQEVQK